MAQMTHKTYQVTESVLTFVHFLGWGIIALGMIGGGLSVLWNVTNPIYFAVGGIALVMNGILIVTMSQLSVTSHTRGDAIEATHSPRVTPTAQKERAT